MKYRKKIKKTILFTVATKNIQYLGITDVRKYEKE